MGTRTPDNLVIDDGPFAKRRLTEKRGDVILKLGLRWQKAVEAGDLKLARKLATRAMR